MKEYTSPETEVVILDAGDIITSSPGTETTPEEERDGVWDLNITVN